MPTRDEVVSELARGYLHDNSTFERVIWLPGGGNTEIHFVIVERRPLNELSPYTFNRPFRGFQVTFAMIDIAERADLLAGRLTLPPSWTVDGAVEFTRAV